MSVCLSVCLCLCVSVVHEHFNFPSLSLFTFYFLLSSWSFCKNFLREHFLGRKNLRLSVKPSKERSITVRRYFVSKADFASHRIERKSCKYIPWNTFNALDSPLQPSSQLRMIADIIVSSANATCYLKFDRVGLPSAWFWLNWMTHSLWWP